MKKQLGAEITLLLITMIWGTTFLVVQNAIAVLPPNTFNGVRFTIATLFLIVTMALFYPKLRHSFTPKLLLSGLWIGFWLYLSYALQTIGLLYTTPSKAGFITGLGVVLVPLFSLLLLKHKLTWQSTASVLAAVLGLYMLTMNQTQGLNVGDVLMFGCAIAVALQLVYTAKYAIYHPALPLAITQLATVALLSWLYAFLFEDWHKAFDSSSMLDPKVTWGLLITAIPATALAFLAQTAFQKLTTPTRMVLIYALEPVFAALTSYLWIDEVLTTRQMIGCFLILSGMLITELPLKAWAKTLFAKKRSPV